MNLIPNNVIQVKRLSFRQIDMNRGRWYSNGKPKRFSSTIGEYARKFFFEDYEEVEMLDADTGNNTGTWAIRRKP